MKVVYDKRYQTVYSSDPASAPGRMESIYKELQSEFEFVEPKPAKEEDIMLVHSKGHIDSVKAHPIAYETALLAVGGAMKASEIAMQSEPAFGLIRPPGHHASRDSSWGFCYFNNVAVAIEKLWMKARIKRALILDVDLHYGDGTANIFASSPNVVYFHPEGSSRQIYVDNVSKFLRRGNREPFDILAISAGFDRHEQDWGGLLKTQDYQAIGKLAKQAADEECKGRIFAVLEGGYNHSVLAKNVKALLQGMM